LTYNDGKFFTYKNLDLVPKLKTSAIQEWFGRLPGNVGIANVRYTTSGKCDDQSIVQGTQPMTAEANGIKIAVSFNGNIVNTQRLLEEMKEHFPSFSCSCDSDLVCNKILVELKDGKDLATAVKATMLSLDGAFSVIGITGDGTFFAFKDPHGIKPLCAGHSPDHKTFAFSS
jgi:amidophosphoribosyltransferase